MKLFVIAGIICAAALFWVHQNPPHISHIGGGFVAKTVCSGIFEQGNRSIYSLMAGELQGEASFSNVHIDYDTKCVHASLPAFPPIFPDRIACYMNDIVGCNLLAWGTSKADREKELEELESDMRDIKWDKEKDSIEAKNLQWPHGDVLNENRISELKKEINTDKLDELLERQFADSKLRTRAFLVSYKGELVVERYAEEEEDYCSVPQNKHDRINATGWWEMMRKGDWMQVLETWMYGRDQYKTFWLSNEERSAERLQSKTKQSQGESDKEREKREGREREEREVKCTKDAHFRSGIPQLGWSMTKSLLNAMWGVRLQQLSSLSLDEDLFTILEQIHHDHSLSPSSSSSSPSPSSPIPYNVSVSHLLRMSSGLDFPELYGKGGKVTEMLFGPQSDSITVAKGEKGVPNPYRVLLNQFKHEGLVLNNPFDSSSDTPSPTSFSPLSSAFSSSSRFSPPPHCPSPCWSYSSATTNILSSYLQATFDSLAQYQLFPYRYLFSRIGMHSMVMDTDAKGLFTSSSFSYASPRDWMRFGLLYFWDGIWPAVSDSPSSVSSLSSALTQGTRIFPEGWVRYTTDVVPSSDGLYGAQWWVGGNHSDTAAQLSTSCLRIESSSSPSKSSSSSTAPRTLTPAEQHHYHTKLSELCDQFHPSRTAVDHSWQKTLPQDAFFAAGYDEQLVVVIPSRDLVVTRLGLTPRQTLDKAQLFEELLACFPGPE